MWYRLIIQVETEDSVKNQDHVRAGVRSTLRRTDGILQVGFIEIIKLGPSRKLKAPPLPPIERLKITDEEKCERFLKRILANRTLKATDVIQQAQAQGFSKRTTHRAKANLGVESRRLPECWYWELKK